MDCQICRSKEAEFEITNHENAGEAKVCVDCLVAVARWSQEIDKEWDDSRGVLPFKERWQVGYAAPISDLLIDLP